MDRADVRVVQGGSSPSLAAEAFQSTQFLRQIVRKKLEGDRATELEILGFVDHTHPATTKLLDDAVVRDGLTNHADVRPGATMLGAIQRASQCSCGIGGERSKSVLHSHQLVIFVEFETRSAKPWGANTTIISSGKAIYRKISGDTSR